MVKTEKERERERLGEDIQLLLVLSAPGIVAFKSGLRLLVSFRVPNVT